MHITTVPGLDSSFQTDDEELMDISEISEELETKNFVTDCDQVCNYICMTGAHNEEGEGEGGKSEKRLRT